MKPLRVQTIVAFTLLAAAGLPVVGSLLAHRLLAGRQWPHVPAHSVVEGMGAFAGLTLAMLLIILRQHRPAFAHHLWTACALISMGVLDGLHASVMPGEAFVWLRSLATLFGGSFFALTWLPERFALGRAAAALPGAVLAASLLLGLLALAGADRLPSVLRPDGQFTGTVSAVNGLGGLLCLAAVPRYLDSYRRARFQQDLIFAHICMLFGAAGLLFPFSQLWSADWWWWHVLRLGAYLVALAQTFLLYQAAEDDLKAANESLERRVAERSATVEQRARELTRSRQDLQAVNGRLQAVLDGATQVSIIATDANGRITVFNTGAERMLGYRAEEMIDRQSPEIIHVPAEIEARARELSQELGRPITGFEAFVAAARQGGYDEREWTYVRKDGTTLTVNLVVTAMREPSGEVSGFLGIAADVSARKQAEQELRTATHAAEAANRAKSEFLANMSHEIRTPMNGILGMTELALATQLTREQRDFLQLVKLSADSLLGILNDILDFSKIEARKLSLEAIPFSLRETLGDTLKPLALRARDKHLELAFQVPPEVPDDLVGDPGRLRQILVNLVGNAIKFTERGEVVVSVRRPNGVERGASSVERETTEGTATSFSPPYHLTTSPPHHLVSLAFAVADTGIGIPAAKCEQIFQAFTQADASTARKYGGTGLGLAISALLVELMGGRIWVESAVGQGSTFHFTVPFGLADRPVIHAAEHGSPVRLRGLPVLIVDDSATNRRILEEILNFWGMRPTAVASAAAALAALQTAWSDGEPFALVLLDAMMPEVDGFTLAGQIKQRSDLGSAVLLMLSSAGAPEDVQPLRELGITSYLTKPIKQSELLDTILTVLHVGPEPAVAPEPDRAKSSARRSWKILLAEDHPINQKLAVRLLEKAGHTVHVADNGRQAVEALAAEAFDLVLMDVQMPELDGLQATAAIRQRERGSGRHVPILAMTAHAMKGDRDRCLEAGMDGYVSKPIQAEELFQTIDRLFAGDSDGQADPNVAPRTAVADRQLALERMNGDESLFHEIVTMSLTELPHLLAEVRSAVDRSDAHQLNMAAHKLKGAVGLFEASAVVALAEQLEWLGHEGNVGDAVRLVAALTLELDRLAAVLNGWNGTISN